MKVHFISDICLIEGFEWRLTVMELWVLRGKKRVQEIGIKYQWRSVDAALWNFERTWPDYNADYVTKGLPLALDALLEKNYPSISQFLEETKCDKTLIPDQNQISLL